MLCDITRIPFDITTDDLDPFTGEVKGEGRLSELSEIRGRKVLDRELRKPRMIHDACKILVKRLAVRQRDEPETSAIVFVGNDKPGDERDNKHAHDVKRAIRSLAPHLRVEVATSSTQKADKTVEQFVQKTDIDVLIVKQMAGLGVDAERLKVCLDLSNVRTLNAFIQRVTRIATVWDRREITGRASDIVSEADYITPDDWDGLKKFNYLIRDQGGGVTSYDLEYKGTVSGGDGDGWMPPDEVVAKEIVLPAEVQDSKLQTSAGESLPRTDRLAEIFPELTKTRTQPDLAKAIPDLERLFRDAEPPAENGAGSGAPERNGSQPTVRNVTDEKAALRKECDTLSREYTFQRLGRRSSRGDKQWEQVIRRFRANHREAAGIPWSNGKGLDEASLEQLTRMRDNMRRELDRLKERQS